MTNERKDIIFSLQMNRSGPEQAWQVADKPPVGARLACDAGAAVLLIQRGACIAAVRRSDKPSSYQSNPAGKFGFVSSLSGPKQAWH
ncbi:hypothetical protein [Pseudomonas sp. R5(2019)]|uniref:hypothetical protein n=1 Tax=Pseudomonas sp. R5(2019) TaxID=2697566 RepID=UPI00141226A3|nr:hypothetical protein [Pseudomonas sp. R5(2019)]